MFIIVESGSTKADWVIVEADDKHQFYQSEGINPSTQSLLPSISDTTLIDNISQATDIYFYGAGADDPSSPEQIKKWLKPYGFTGVAEVRSDMYAAARACCGLNSGIVCILGTGSNSCVYDGNDIVEAIPSLGYIFSDEGGGVHLGKQIIREYFYGMMPEKEKKHFESIYHLSKSQVIEAVYRNQKGSKYIASFAEFLAHVEGDWKDTLIKNVFREFISLRIINYRGYKDYPLMFVGSIAFHYKNHLEQTLAEYGLKATAVIQKPIFQLIDYHIRQKQLL